MTIIERIDNVAKTGAARRVMGTCAMPPNVFRKWAARLKRRTKTN